MSSISDLAGYGNPLIIPEDTGHIGDDAKSPSDLFTVVEVNDNGVPVKKLDVNSYADQSVKPIIVGGQSLTDGSQHKPTDHNNRVIQRPVDRGDIDDLGSRLQHLGKTLAKYDFSSDPGFALKLTNKLLGSNLTNDYELIKMIPSDHRDEIMGAYNAVKNLLNKKKKTSYDLLRLLLNPGGKFVKGSELGSQLLSTGLNKVSSIAGNDIIKKEFEKSRGPIRLPNHRDKELLQPTWFSESASKGKISLKDAKNNLAKIATNVLKNAIGIESEPGIDSNLVINSSSTGGMWDIPMISDDRGMFLNRGKSGPAYNEYTRYDDPLSNSESFTDIQSYLQRLNQEGLLTGYKDYAGFEIGSNHDWMIKIYPYPHDEADKQKFNALGRFTCVPPLPYYGLPNMWYLHDDITDIRRNAIINDSSSSKSWSPFKGGKSKFSKAAAAIGNSVANSAKHWLEDRYNGLVNGDTKNDITANQIFTDEFDVTKQIDRAGVGYVSFGEYCPALSYDLNYGSPKTEDVRLFNGSSMQVIHGMQYNITLNVSILDDVYHSMQKYMNQYYNCIYDLGGSSMAPYYACAFDIRLYVFRSGKQINHAIKLIGIPIDYPIKLEGSQDPNESRVDITFSIIGAGLMPNRVVYGPNQVHDASLPHIEKHLAGSYNRMSEIKWSDILVKARGNQRSELN